MKLKLTLASGNAAQDIVVTADTTAPAGVLIDRIRHRASHPEHGGTPIRSLVVNRGTPGERVVPAAMTLGEAGIRSGDVISLSASDDAGRRNEAPAATLSVTSGPGGPRSIPLRRGTNLIGRERTCDVRLDDPLVSKRHARLNVTDMVEIIDDGSANGIVVGERTVDRAVLRPGVQVTLGDTTFTVTLHQTDAAGDDAAGALAFNRSPRLDPSFAGVTLAAPEIPKSPPAQRFPIVTLVAPIMMAGMIFAITRNATSILFVALSPLMMVGAWVENRMANGRALERATAGFRSALVDLSVQLQYAADLERTGRRSEHPATAEIEAAVRDLSSLTWTRRPEHESFLRVRLGLGTQPSRNTVEMPTQSDGVIELRREVDDLVARFSSIDRVPVVADLRRCGNVGVAGPSTASEPVAAAIVAQLVGVHSPSEVVFAAVAGERSARWDWLKWLPHVGSEFSPLECPHLAGDPVEANTLVSAIEEVIEQRSVRRSGVDEGPVLPFIVVFVSDDAPIERARLVQIAERGPSTGVHVLWHAVSLQRLPAACRAFVEVDGLGGERAGDVESGTEVTDLEAERIDAASAHALARRLAPVVDSGTRVDDQSDLPRSVSFLALAGLEVAESPTAVIESWQANNSLPLPPGQPRRRRDNTLRALVGVNASGPMYLDLRAHGPHALVGGTTGAGKSEFLQSWVLGMATMHSPSRVTFLFVDYKGGAAFAECVELPHCVGLVTDLSPHLVRRALTSLNAELHHREVIINAKGAKDLLELERRNDPEAPPSLVIVVDEFAALVSEVPEFVDGVVNVAQRGRSLGLHLVLATQRPAGVIKDNLRANTNLRVALRMADDDDSNDVVGTKLAATFDPGLPGRGVAKTGPGRLWSFQSAYVGGHTSNDPPKPSIEIRDLVFGQGSLWDEPPEQQHVRDDGPNDIKRIVATVKGAAAKAHLPSPRRPWLAELAPLYRLEELPTRRTDTELVFGVLDDPRAQAQPEIAFRPDEAGNMVVYGAGGTGKSTFLRSIAFAAALASARGGPCHVYGLDFGSRGLTMLEGLPHVGSIIGGDDDERVQRLLRTLKDTVDERATRYAATNADTIVEYRERAGRPDEPRVIVLVDNVGGFRSAYESTNLNRYWDLFQSLAAQGRAVGVHFVVSADRPGAVSSSLASTIQQRLVLRLASEMDYLMVDAPQDGFTQTSPPGRGFVDGREVQVAVFSGNSNIAVQAEQLARHATSMLRADVSLAPPVKRLPDIVALSELPPEVGGRPTLGLWDETLEPIGLQPVGSFLVTGPPLSGRTTVVATIVRSLKASKPNGTFVYLGQRRSPLGATIEWSHSAVGPADIAALAAEIAESARDLPPGALTIVIEGVGDLLNSECDVAVQELVKACRANDHFVVAEGETSSVTGSWPLLQAVKVSRAGIALQPDQMDGDSIFKTTFPRAARAEFPPGRGLLVSGGKTYRVQVATPE